MIGEWAERSTLLFVNRHIGTVQAAAGTKEQNMKKPIAQQVWELTEPTAISLGYTLWDVEYVKEGADWILRLTIDKPGALSGEVPGISIDDCEIFHRAIDPLLDEADPIEGAYTLEVSSPGVERVLSRPEHFEACAGLEVIARCFTAVNGARVFQGKLVGMADDSIVITTEAGNVSLPRKAVSKVETVFAW